MLTRSKTKEKINEVLVYLPTMDTGVALFFQEYGYKVSDDINDIWDADLAVFTGGADVSPFLYGEKIHPTTKCDVKRDLRENAEFRMMPTGMPKVGICRGAQFLNVMSGGSMYQDVDNHGKNHVIIDPELNRDILVTSTHHQMMSPNENGELLCYAKESTERHTDIGSFTSTKNTEDAEVVFYEHTQSLCVQYHPEYVWASADCVAHFWSLLDRVYGGKVMTDKAYGKGVRPFVA